MAKGSAVNPSSLFGDVGLRQAHRVADIDATWGKLKTICGKPIRKFFPDVIGRLPRCKRCKGK